MDPYLVLMKGHPATGKSSLAAALAAHLGWPLLVKDDIKDSTFPLPRGNELAYTILWRIVERQLGCGLSTIVDSPLSSIELYETGTRLADRLGTRLLVIETKLDDNTWRRRLDARRPLGLSHQIDSWSQMEELLRGYAGSWRYPIDDAVLVRVQTVKPVALLVADLVARLSRDEDGHG